MAGDRHGPGHLVAVNPDLLRVADMLRRHALADDGPVDLEPLAGGYRNLVYRWRRSGGDRVVKVLVPSNGNPLFPTLPDHEQAAMRLLSGRGICPDLVTAFDDTTVGPALVYEWVPGEPWRSGAASVGGLFAAVHEVTGPDAAAVGIRQLATSPAQIADHARRMSERSAVCDLIDRAERLATVGPPLRTPCLVHTDAGPGNVIAGPHGVRLIDWQCPGVGDPVEDLAGFESPAIHHLYDRPPLAATEVMAFRVRYGERAGRENLERLDAWGPLYRARIAAYCAYRADELRRSDPAVARRYEHALRLELGA